MELRGRARDRSEPKGVFEYATFVEDVVQLHWGDNSALICLSEGVISRSKLVVPHVKCKGQQKPFLGLTNSHAPAWTSISTISGYSISLAKDKGVEPKSFVIFIRASDSMSAATTSE